MHKRKSKTEIHLKKSKDPILLLNITRAPTYLGWARLMAQTCQDRN